MYKGRWMKRPPITLALAAVLVAAIFAADSWARVTAAAPHLTITPSHALVDARIEVRVTGLHAHSAATLQVTTNDYLGKPWRGRVVYGVDRRGVIDTHASGRIFWSITGSDGPGFGPPLGAADVKIALLVNRRIVTQGVLVRRGSASGVVEHDTTVASDGFVGMYFAPPTSSKPAPAVLVIGGSGGGYTPYPAILLASHGYPSLSLGYFKAKGLPQTLQNIPLEYFAKALRWLAAQPGVDPKRVVILGASRGGEAALLLGTTYPDLVHGVLAASPSDHVLGGLPDGFAWTLNGEPVLGDISVERIAGPVLAFAGGEDAIVGKDGAAWVKRIAARARAHGRTDVRGIVYQLAGHGVVGIPNLPPAGEIEIAPHAFVDLGGLPPRTRPRTRTPGQGS
jgi:dienelactone hydrolase